jgi:hypothetical protein
MRPALAGCAMLVLAACAGGVSAPLRSSAWIADGHDPVTVLTLQPAACLSDGASATPLVQQGEALFNSPLLLGGQAAKAGLSCASCHRNGRGNPAFFFTGLSAAAGHADVTDAFLGPQRADGISNPVAIPDLADVKAGHVARDTAALSEFLTSQLTQEFDAAPPTPETLAALSAYVGAIKSENCSAESIPMSAADELQRAERALLHSAGYSNRAPDAEAALRQAARAALGRVHERFPAPSQNKLRRRLAEIARRIGAAEPATVLAADIRQIAPEVSREMPYSLYDPQTLRRFIAD